jgi:hypothetical protein
MRGFPEHFPRFVPNSDIEFYVKSLHCYCLYAAIISDINGYYYQYSNYLKKVSYPQEDPTDFGQVGVA